MSRISERDSVAIETLKDLAKLESRYLSDHEFRSCFCIVICHAGLSEETTREMLPLFQARLSGCQHLSQSKLLFQLESICQTVRPDMRPSITVKLGAIANDGRDRISVLQYQDFYSDISRFETKFLREIISVDLLKLNSTQKLAYKTLMRELTTRGRKRRVTRNGLLFHIDGAAGSGKTFLLNVIISKLRLRNNGSVLAVASSGLAATNLIGGQSASSMFQLNGSRSHESSVELKLRNCDVIFWDECSMIDVAETLKDLDKMLQKIHSRPGIPMGGVAIVFAGDFRKTTPQDGFESSLKNWRLWPKVEKLSLGRHEAIETSTSSPSYNPNECDDLSNGYNKIFRNHLLAIGDGTHPFDPPNTNIINIPDDFCVFIRNQRDLVTAIYQDNHWTRRRRPDWLTNRVILAPTNRLVEQHHRIITREIWRKKNTRFYKSKDRCLSESNASPQQSPDGNSGEGYVGSSSATMQQQLNSLMPRGFPPHLLALQTGAPIMLIYQLDAQKLTTGTRLRVDGMHKNYIEATILTGLARGERVHIPRVVIRQEEDEQISRHRLKINESCRMRSRHPNANIKLERFQFPIQLAYSMTIHKGQNVSQWQTVGIDLSTSCFAHGQLYAAMSRAKQADKMFVLSTNRWLQRTRNIIDYRALE